MALSLAIFPLLILQVIDNTFIEENQTQAQWALLTIIALFVIRGVAHFFNIYATNKLSGNLSGDLQKTLFDKLLNLPANHFSNNQHQEIIATFTCDVQHATETLTRLITILILDSLTILGLMICAQLLNWELSSLLFLLIPFLIVTMMTLRGFVENPDQRVLKTIKTLTRHIVRVIENLRIIFMNSGWPQESRRLEKNIQARQQAHMHLVTLKAFILSTCQTFMILALIALSYVITQQVFSQSLTLAEVSALVATVLLMIAPMRRIAGIPGYLQQGEQAAKNIFSLLEQVSKESEAETMTHINGVLIFDKIHFYSTNKISPFSDGISFAVKPGEIVALVCQNQQQKIMLIDLVLGFSQPSSGKILLDSQPFENIKLTDLHRHIAMISNKTVLLEETIAGNITYGANRCANEAKITAAAQASHAMDFIRQMPEGLQTSIGKDKTELTELQRQHLAIAHGLLQNPALLILDDVPNNYYFENRCLMDALKTLMHGRATLIITDSMPTWKAIDRIVRIY